MHVRQIFYAAVVFQLGLLSALPTQATEQLSTQERAWFETFQKGTLYACGWQDITAKLLAKAPVDIKCDLQKRLEALGAKIGREWSRNNDIRKIDNTMLRQWGKLLQQTAEQEPDKIPQAVEKLNQKVEDLLN
ncbi:hypothetical protein [Candidatus Electronema sp. PJ]|uniref:hypothetical protein n=1 Tax=Candidatus Electronema sp. PJ TaxID=3401572 RepID=UPI003AA917FA